MLFALFAAGIMLSSITSLRGKVLYAYQNNTVDENIGIVRDVSMYEGRGTFYIGETKLTYYKRRASRIHGFYDNCSPECVLVPGKRLRVAHIDGDITELVVIN